MQNAGQGWIWPIRNDHIVERERRLVIAAEPGDENTLPMLRHPAAGIDDPEIHLIPKLIKGVQDDTHRVALVMAQKVFHVLQQERPGFVMAQDPDNIKEQGALGFIGKPVSPAKRILLADARKRKWLTRKPGKEKIVGRDVGGINKRDVSGDFMLLAKIGPVGLLRKLVNLAGEHAFATDRVEPSPQTADPREKINELEGAGGLVHDYILLNHVYDIATCGTLSPCEVKHHSL